MDSESEQPNSSSVSSAVEGISSNSSSSSNLLAISPLVLQGQSTHTDTETTDAPLSENNLNNEIGAGLSLALNTPSQSPSPYLPSQPQLPAMLATNDERFASDSVFVTPLLLNSTSSISDSSINSSNTPSSSSSTTPPHQEHFTLSSSRQQTPPQQHQALSSITPTSSLLLPSRERTDSESQIAPITQGHATHSDIQNEQRIDDSIDAPLIASHSSSFLNTLPASIDQQENRNVVLNDAPINNLAQTAASDIGVISPTQQSSSQFSIRPSQLTALLPTPPPRPTESVARPKVLELSCSFGDNSRNRARASANYNNNQSSFYFGHGLGNIGGAVTSMFSNYENNSAAAGSSSSGGASGSHRHHQAVDRIKALYPNVNESETPLPRCWSPHDKCLSIGLAQNNLRVHYKGGNKQHNEAASVRTAHPIPPACGLYYFEVKIISKGKNGYMGIGLTAQQFRMNRLPGWDKQSYGYHGDDGNSFSSSGSGQSYGPTFTTGDIIGCCVNFVNNTCFYTKNGIDLGIAFRDLPTRLYPTVGLQTPGEEVDANFGQEPFKFDQIEDMMKQMRLEVSASIYNFPMPADQGDPTTLLHKLVISYLVHNGHSQTAEAFARATSQSFHEDLASIRNRQKILKLIMTGRMGQAIEHTLRSYPGLLENNKNLWFMLKCRQFVEMVNGSDTECCNAVTGKGNQKTPPNQTSVIQSTKTYQNGKSTSPNTTTKHTTQTPSTMVEPITLNAPVIKPGQNRPNATTRSFFAEGEAAKDKNNENTHANLDYNNDVEMDNIGLSTNGDSYQNGNSSNHLNNSIEADEAMDVEMSPSVRKFSNGIERILEFGKELSQMGQLLEKEGKMKDEDRQMLEDAFSLIAYSNPWSSPLGWQLCPSKREVVCTALNSAILESVSYPRRPPLDVCVGHANELLRTMAQASLGACAFINVEDIFPQH